MPSLQQLLKKDNDMKGEPIRVLQVVTLMERAGLESRLMDIYRNIDRSKIQFDFLTHRMEEGDYDEEIRSLGGIVYHIPGIKPWTLLQYNHNLNVFFQEHSGYKIIHVHLNTYSGFVQYAAKRAGIPVRITHSRANGIDKDWKWIFKALSKQIVNGPTTHKFACSIQAGEFLFGKKGIMPPNEFMVIPNGFNLTRFSFNPEKREEMRDKLLLSDHLAVVHVGRLSAPKNHKYLVEIFNCIHNKRPNSKLFLIGDGELRHEIELQVSSLGLTDSVVFLGSIPNVGDYLQAMDVMVFPSLYEGFGTVVLETQCCGLPTLATEGLPKETKITECLEFMNIHDNPNNWAKKAIQMTTLIERKDRTADIRKAGYDIQDTYKILSDFYLSMAAKYNQ